MTAKGKAAGGLMASAIKFLKRANRRNRPGRMRPWARDHVIGGGHVNAQGRGSGYHYRPGGQDFPGRRIIPGTKNVDTRTGAYTAEPEYWNPNGNPPGWVPKGGNNGVSSFFPDNWTAAEVDAAIPGAFRNAQPIGGNMWRGEYRNVVIEGYYHQGGLGHGWPVV
ncbi:EndoU domain-containing protein [Actinomadura sp. 9N215]|uniref:EndoU domain-containing protein n=1 Tax=Actinomadura sp. 9N215 TaxID=3375150 RepID=UPI0037BCC77C